MDLNERNAEIVLEALAEKIHNLKIDIYLKDAEIDSLRERVKQLEAELEARSNGKN